MQSDENASKYTLNLPGEPKQVHFPTEKEKQLEQASMFANAAIARNE